MPQLCRWVAGWSLTALLFAPLTASAAAPTQVNYQGQLKAGGSLFNGTAAMKFAIVDGATSLWSNDSTSVGGAQPTGTVSVVVENGLFTVALGAPPMKALTPAVFAGATNPTLRVWVNTGSGFDQLSDQPFGSVPFSLQGTAADGLWNSADSSVYRRSGNVGIGTDSPPARLSVVGGSDVNLTIGSGYLVLGPNSTGLTLAADDNEIQARRNDTPSTLHLQASGGNLTLAAGGGRVGIGTGSPGNALDVIGGAAFQGNHLYLRNRSSPGGSQTWGFVVSSASGILNLGRATDVPPEGGSLEASVVKLMPSAPANSLIIDDTGHTAVKVLEITGGSDLAEPFVVGEGKDGPASPGMVVSMDPSNPGELRLASEPYDRRVVGVISGANGLMPGMVMRAADTAVGDGTHNVALSGRAYVNATTVNGRIEPGDLLTTSSIPGHAMRASDHRRARGAVLGKAMSYLHAGTGFVLLLVQPQ